MTWELSPFIVALVVLIVWVTITLTGGVWQAGGRTDVEKLISNQLVYCFVVASIFLVAVIASTGWWREVGLQPDGSTSNYKVLIAPGLAVVVVWMIAFRRGIRRTTLILAGVNTLLVGFSEEVMFRGILFHATETSFGHEWAVIATAVMFGSVHALNAVITGKPVQAVEQAVLITLFGFWLGVVRLYLSTLYPLIIIHWLWDFGLLAAGLPKAAPAEKGLASKILPFLPLAISIALCAYGLWLLHAYGNRD